MIPSASQRDLGEVGEEIILALERNITMHKASDLGESKLALGIRTANRKETEWKEPADCGTERALLQCEHLISYLD